MSKDLDSDSIVRQLRINRVVLKQIREILIYIAEKQLKLDNKELQELKQLIEVDRKIDTK